MATTTSEKNTELVRNLGADVVINYETQDIQDYASKFDVVFDTIGGDVLGSSYDVVKQGGRLVTIAGQPDASRAQEKGITALYVNSSPDVEQLNAIAQLASEGKVKIVIADTFPLTVEGVRNAHLLSESGHARGKVIVRAI